MSSLSLTLSFAAGLFNSTPAQPRPDETSPARAANYIASAVTSSTATLRIAPDDTVLSVNSTNYSTNTILTTYTWPDYQIANAILMKFDLSAIPQDATVESATLHMALVQTDSMGGTYTVSAHKIIRNNPDVTTATGYTADGTTPWTPNNCCYNGVPLAQADLSPAYDAPAIDTAAGFKQWDLTRLVQEWLQNPAANFGVILNSDASAPRDRYRFFASTEHTSESVRPYLDITLSGSDVTPPIVAIASPATGSSVANTISVAADASDNTGVAGVQFQINAMPLGPEVTVSPYSVTWDTTTLSDGAYAVSAVARDFAGNKTISPDVNVSVANGVLLLAPRDTYLALNDTNASGQSILATYTWPDKRPANAVVMKFDMTAVPAGTTVQEAQLYLSLVQSDTTATSTYTVKAHKLIGKNPDVAKATGYTADGTTAWTPNACCHEGIPLAQADISAAYETKAIDKTPGFKVWTITSMVQEWLRDSAKNFGVVLNPDVSAPRDRYRYFASTEDPDARRRPFLRVKYGPSSGDTMPPSVSIAAPASGATVSSTVSVTANAGDNVGVTGVQFAVDAAPLGAEDTSAPYTASWDTTSSANGSHTITAVAKDAAGNTTMSGPVTVSVSNSGGAGWPNEPAGFATFNDQPWDTVIGNGWNYLRRSATLDSTIANDSAAPFSPPNELQIVFTPDMQPDSEPSVHWLGLPGLKEIYTGWWMKLSPNWDCSPAGCGKVTFLFTDGAGQVYTGVYHSDSGGGPPYRIAVNTEWAPYGQQIWYPNASTTPVSPGEWHRIEVYYKWETNSGASGDGIIRWWVDGVLNGNYTNVHYPASSFVEFQYAPTLQNPPAAEQYMYVDHTYVSRP